MANKLLIIKDEKDHITKVVHEIIHVLNLHFGKNSVAVTNIHDIGEFDDTCITNKPFILFVLTDGTNSFENRVPSWLFKLNIEDQSKLRFKYLIVRELHACFEQQRIANQTSNFWVENEKDLCNQLTTAANVIKVDHINEVLKWWPHVIENVFKTRKATRKVSVVTEDKVIVKDIDNDSDINAKVQTTIQDVSLFFQKYNAFAAKPEHSNKVLLYVVGDSKTFYENHKYLRQKKINGYKITLILVRGRTAPELRDISTGQFYSVNMISDAIQMMVDLGIISERKTLKKTITVNQVETATFTQIDDQQVKIFWRFKSKDSVISNAGNVSIQFKNESNDEWEEVSSIEASGSSGETVISNAKDNECQIMYEDAKTGHMSSPVGVNSVSRHHVTNCGDRLYLPLFIILMIFSFSEALVASYIVMPLAGCLDCICTTKDDNFIMFALTYILPFITVLIKITLIIVIPQNFGPIYFIPTVVNFIVPVGIFVYLFKDEILKKMRKVFCRCSGVQSV